MDTDPIQKQIVLLNRARAMLAEVHTPEQAQEIRAQAKALRTYFNSVKSKYDSTASNLCIQI